MFIFRKNKKLQKNSIKKSGKRGFTLVELSVVLALVAIVTVMIVSFSIMMEKFSASAQAEYKFLEDSGKLKEQIITEISRYDVLGKEIHIDSGEIKVKGEDVDFEFATDSTLSIEFAAGNNNLIRCTIKNDKIGISTNFVIALRSASVVKEAVDE